METFAGIVRNLQTGRGVMKVLLCVMWSSAKITSVLHPENQFVARVDVVTKEWMIGRVACVMRLVLAL